MTFSGGSALSLLETLDSSGTNGGQGGAAGGGGIGSDGGGGANNAGYKSRVDDPDGAEGEKTHGIYHISGEDTGENVHKEAGQFWVHLRSKVTI